MLKLYDAVWIDCMEGFGGPAVIVEVRESTHNKYKVRMNDGSQPDFWAHDGEITPLVTSNPSSYDSRPETYQHIQRVQFWLDKVIDNVKERARIHDQSKLVEPELSVFNVYTPKLKDSTYGSDEYERFLEEMKPALLHHYDCNSHHPEHYPESIYGMSFLDVIEMLCDWKAATERHQDGNLEKSIEFNQKRFGYDGRFKRMLTKTAKELRLI